MSRGIQLIRFGIEAALRQAGQQRIIWESAEQKSQRVVHREGAGNAKTAWKQMGLAAEHALDFLDATTDRFATQAAVQVETHTGNALGAVEALALALSQTPGDRALRQAYESAEVAVTIAEEIQAFVLERTPPPEGNR